MARKKKKTMSKNPTLKAEQREAIIAEVLDNLDDYIKKVPELRKRIFEEILKNDSLYQKIAQKVAEELT